MCIALRITALSLLAPLLVTGCGVAPPTAWVQVEEATPGHTRVQSAVGVFEDDRGRRVTLALDVHVGEPAYYDELFARVTDDEVVLVEYLPWNPPKEGGPGDELAAQALDELRRFHANRPEPHPGTGLVVPLYWKARLTNAVWADVFFSVGKARHVDAPDYEDLLCVPRATRVEQLRAPSEPAAALTPVLIDSRNQIALRRLDGVLRDGRRRVAISYGVLHGPGLAEGLEARGFTLVEPVRWLTAFDVPPASR